MYSLLESARNWAQHSPADDFWPIAIGLSIGSVICFIAGFVYLYRKRIIEDTPTSKIRSAAQGYSELIGINKFIDNEPVVAPLTGIPCVWYQFRIEERRSTGKSTKWVTIDKGISDNLFMLTDDTGEVLVDPEDASVSTRHKNTWYGHNRTPLKKGLPKKKLIHLGTGKYRYTERRLHPDEILYAIGLFNTVGGANSRPDINSDVRELISEWKQNCNALLEKYDGNRDGEFDLVEWEKVREAARNEVISNHNELVNMPSVNMLGKTCDRRRPYLLSAYPQSELVIKYRFYSWMLLSVFFCTGLISTWLISTRIAG